MSAPTAKPAPKPRHRDSSLKETLESIIIAFILAFVFRAFVVEAFVIPTGSMAPTLLGAHVRVTSPDSGYHFAIGPRDTHPADPRVALPVQGGGEPLKLWDPMTGERFDLNNVKTNTGDRILVLKYIYRFMEPRRWDVVVFKNPENASDNYIKRLIGLPGEQIWIVRGNIYTRPLDDEDGTWQIQRKTEDAQAAVWQPIYYSRYVPMDPEVRADWVSPWQPMTSSDEVSGEVGGAWTPIEEGRAFRWTPGEAGNGVLNFQFDSNQATDFYAYNMAPPRRSRPRVPYTIEDLRAAVTVEPSEQGAAAWITMTTDNAGGETIFDRIRRQQRGPTIDPDQHEPPLREWRGSISADGTVRLEVRKRFEASAPEWVEVQTQKTQPLPVGRGTRLELTHVDQQVSFRVNGQRLITYQYSDELTTDQLRDRTEVMHNPQVRVGVSGAPVELYRLNLDRDLYYTSGEDKDALASAEPFAIRDDEFFTLGDNSPQSKDSRLWERVDPWVNFYAAKPEDAIPVGVIPRQLMLGRAFFVYWPAPYRLSPDGFGFIPNFGDMRFID